jgi:hypothetical protein
LAVVSLFAIGQMSADQIGIRQGARSFQLRGGLIKQNEIFEKSQELEGRSEKFKTSRDSSVEPRITFYDLILPTFS